MGCGTSVPEPKKIDRYPMIIYVTPHMEKIKLAVEEGDNEYSFEIADMTPSEEKDVIRLIEQRFSGVKIKIGYNKIQVCCFQDNPELLKLIEYRQQTEAFFFNNIMPSIMKEINSGLIARCFDEGKKGKSELKLIYFKRKLHRSLDKKVKQAIGERLDTIGFDAVQIRVELRDDNLISFSW